MAQTLTVDQASTAALNFDSGPNFNTGPNFNSGPNYDSGPYLVQRVLASIVDPNYNSGF